MNKKLHEIRKKKFQIAKMNARLLQDAKFKMQLQDSKCERFSFGKSFIQGKCGIMINWFEFNHFIFF